MFIDCTGPTIRVNPRSQPEYETGLVIQLLSIQPPGRSRVGYIRAEAGGLLPPTVTEEDFLVGSKGSARLTFSLTEHLNLTTFEETGGEMFTVSCYYQDGDNNLLFREFMVSVVDLPGEGWIVEIEGQEGGGGDCTIRLALAPEFNPRAVIPLMNEPQEEPEKAPEKPPGRPIWERLGEDD